MTTRAPKKSDSRTDARSRIASAARDIADRDGAARAVTPRAATRTRVTPKAATTSEATQRATRPLVPPKVAATTAATPRAAEPILATEVSLSPVMPIAGSIPPCRNNERDGTRQVHRLTQARRLKAPHGPRRTLCPPQIPRLTPPSSLAS